MNNKTKKKKVTKNSNSNIKKNVNKKGNSKKVIKNKSENNKTNKPLVKGKSKDLKKDNESERNSTKNQKLMKILIIIYIILLVIIIIIGGGFIYQNTRSKFKDYQIELGTKEVKLENFIRKNTDMQKCKAVTDLNKLDLSKTGNIDIELTYNNKKEIVKLIIVDTTAPELEVKDLEIYLGEEKPGKDAYIVSTFDLSGEVKTEITNTEEEGNTIKYTIVATDKNNNKTEKVATLKMVKDTVGPEISGLSNLTIKKYSNVDYTSGVSANDAKDGKVDFTYDASGVDTSKTGTYYVTYTASDKSGNKTVKKRKVVVDHSAEDTVALVNSVASTLSSDPEVLRDYCRNKIKYSTNGGGDDPLWYGLNNHQGNCKVHALCFQALLNAKGIENMLIWTTNNTHTWNLVKINGVWRHMDSTPDRNHRKISIMTDEQRLSTLSGRKWDFSAWPAAN